MTASLLTKKDRALHPHGQVAKLVRIAKRAEAKADWLDEILSGSVMSMDMVDVPETETERDGLRARANAAVDLLCEIVVENPDCSWTLPQRRQAELRTAAR